MSSVVRICDLARFILGVGLADEVGSWRKRLEAEVLGWRS